MFEKIENNNIVEHETNISIGDVYFDKRLENILDMEEFKNEIQKINKKIEEYLGENKNSSIYNFRIYSDRKEYENYLRTNFPEKPEENYIVNDMVYYYDEESNSSLIAKFMELGDYGPNDPRVKEYAQKRKIKPEEAGKQNYKENIYPTIAHEMTHSHSFFKGIHYRVAGNKWAQEMVCIFIDQKKWEEYNDNYREITETKAREQAEGKILYNEIIKDYNEGDFDIEDWERFFYQFLENEYGKERLIKFWEALSNTEVDFEKSFKNIFGEKLRNVMKLFQEEIMKEKK